MTGRTSGAEYHGLLVLDKPGGMTSRDAVNLVQRTLPRGIKIGHTGTLDPLATGVLVVCLGHATRLAEYVQAMPKFYRSTILLGATSDTDDADGNVAPRPDAVAIELQQLELRLAEFIGNIEQVPPAFSAVKVGGRRSYEVARAGGELDLTARRVWIDRIDIVAYAWPYLEIEIKCGKGTYIRSLARDLGKRLGCGGLIEKLRRIAVGPFTAELGVAPDTTLAVISANLRPMKEAVNWMWHVWVDDVDAARLRHGQAIRAKAEFSAVVLDQFGQLVAVCEPEAGGWLRPLKVIPATGVQET